VRSAPRRHRRPARLFEESRHHPRLRPGGRQAQHVAKELADTLTAKGVEVFYAIHPVRGACPAHERPARRGQRPLRQLKEMDEANPELATADVALVVGANDTVTPRRATRPGAPSTACRSSMPTRRQRRVLEALDAPGLRRIDNELLYDRNDAAFRRRQGHPDQAGRRRQRRLSWSSRRADLRRHPQRRRRAI